MRFYWFVEQLVPSFVLASTGILAIGLATMAVARQPITKTEGRRALHVHDSHVAAAGYPTDSSKTSIVEC